MAGHDMHTSACRLRLTPILQGTDLEVKLDHDGKPIAYQSPPLSPKSGSGNGSGEGRGDDDDPRPTVTIRGSGSPRMTPEPTPSPQAVRVSAM